jgi:hypothetical protein
VKSLESKISQIPKKIVLKTTTPKDHLKKKIKKKIKKPRIKIEGSFQNSK